MYATSYECVNFVSYECHITFIHFVSYEYEISYKCDNLSHMSLPYYELTVLFKYAISHECVNFGSYEFAILYDDLTFSCVSMSPHKVC